MVSFPFAGFAPAVALAVVGREFNHHIDGKFSLTAHEDPLPGDKYIIEYNRWAVFRVTDVADITAIDFPVVQTGTTDHMDQARGVIGYGKGHGIILIAFFQRAGWQNDDFMR